MRRIVILAALILVAGCKGNCATTYFPPLQPIKQTNDLMQNDTVSSANINDNFSSQIKDNYSNLSMIEQSLFGKNYANQNLNSRLTRIERALFSTTHPQAPSAQRIDNIISNFNQINKNPNISRNTLSRLESKVFGQNFSQNNPEIRIERLEEQIFGAAQSGDLDARCKSLQIAAKTYNANNMSDDFSTQSYTTTGGGWKNILSGLGGSMMSGTMTGFSPSIDPYSQYNGYNTSYSSPYTQNRLNRQFGRHNVVNTLSRALNPYSNYNPYLGSYGTNQGYRTNYGYGNFSQNCTSGAGVTILD